MEVGVTKTPPMEILKEFSQNSNIRRALLFIFLLMLAGFSVVPFISDYLVNNVGLDLDELKYVYLCGGLATVASSIFVGRLADKLGKVKTFIITAAISILPLGLVTVLPIMPLIYVLMFNVVFFICFGARFVPAVALMTACVQPKRRGSFLSISSAIQQLGSGIAVVISSFIIVNGAKGELYYFGWVGIVACVATVLSILVSLRIKEVS